MSILKKIQVISDIHIDFGKDFPLIPKTADVLFLAGDIGQIEKSNFKPFFDYISKNWKQTFYVLGNHEFYSDSIDIHILTNKYINFFKQYDNITLLNRNKVEYEGYQILGCTLWSNPTVDTRYLNDFRKIKKNYEVGGYGPFLAPINLDNFRSFHFQDLKWLQENYDKSKPTIIMTHFPLISTLKGGAGKSSEQRLSHPKYDDEDLQMSTYFMNNIQIESDGVSSICISGHTHYSHDFTRNHIRYISNQLGYHGELSESRYQDKPFYFNID